MLTLSAKGNVFSLSFGNNPQIGLFQTSKAQTALGAASSEVFGLAGCSRLMEPITSGDAGSDVIKMTYLNSGS